MLYAIPIRSVCLSSLLLLFLRGCLFFQSRAMTIQNIWQLGTHDYELLSWIFLNKSAKKVILNRCREFESWIATALFPRERNQYKVIPGCAAKTSKLVRKRKSIEGSLRTCTIIVYPTKCEFLELGQNSTHLGHLLEIEPFTFSRRPTSHHSIGTAFDFLLVFQEMRTRGNLFQVGWYL